MVRAGTERHLTKHSNGPRCAGPVNSGVSGRVAAALADAGIPAPVGYTTELSFRRCTRCGQINVVKDLAFECAVCGSALPSAWNLEAVADTELGDAVDPPAAGCSAAHL
jgi:hypothetical protein